MCLKKVIFVFNTSALLGLAYSLSLLVYANFKKEATIAVLASFFHLLWELCPWDFRHLLIHLTTPPIILLS